MKMIKMVPNVKNSSMLYHKLSGQLNKHDPSTIRKYPKNCTEDLGEKYQSLHYPSFELHVNENDQNGT